MNPVLAAVAGALLTLTPALAAAQAYPSKVIRMIVPLAPGGADGLIGTQTVAGAVPDGYTLINVSPSLNSSLTTARSTRSSSLTAALFLSNPAGKHG